MTFHAPTYPFSGVIPMQPRSDRYDLSDKIITAVCQEFGIMREELLGTSRKQPLPIYRQLLSWLLNETQVYTQIVIAEILMYADHTAVFYNINKFEDIINTTDHWGEIAMRLREVGT